MKIKAKIVLLLFGTFSLSTALLASLVYVFISDYSFTDFYHRLEIRALATARIELGGNAPDIEAFRRESLQRLDNETDYILNTGVDWQTEAMRKGISPVFVKQVLAQGKAIYRKDNTFYAGVLYTAAPQPHVVVVSADNYYEAHHMAYMRNLLLLGGFAALVLLAVISTVLTRILVRPLADIAAQARRISSENLHLRIKVANSKDELGAVARTMNDMLDRLETTFESQKNFISNASHELKTPLTAIIGEADVVLARQRGAEEYIHSIETIQTEAEKLSRKTEAILALAQTGFDTDGRDFKRLRADELVIEVCGKVRRLYPDRRIEVDFSLLPESAEKLKVRGNAQLLQSALSNILANACKYSSEPVRVSLAASEDNVIFVVQDRGVGIPEAELQYIYDPFFRASNVRGFAGYGIGLPLARNIVRMHFGTISIRSAPHKGTTAEITLPIANV